MGGPAEEEQRLFIAVPLPDALLGFVRGAQSCLPPIPGLRLLRPDQLHLTLAFIGEVDREKVEAARVVVEALPAYMGGEGVITRYLFLPSERKARVVALEISDGEGVFEALYERIAEGLEAAGVMQREKRPFRPHLTIARLRIPGPVRPRSESGEASFAVQSVCLYRSELRREGATYTVLERAVFGRTDGAKA